MKRRMKRRLSSEKPTVWIGKNGASQEVLAEIDSQLERTELVKVKLLKAALEESDAKAITNKIAQQVESTLVEVRGHTFLLFRKKKKKSA